MARRSQGTGRVGRSRSDWERLVGAYEQSELTRKAFCAERSISVGSLDYWRGKLRREAAGPGFIELPAMGGSAWDMEIELGGGVVVRMRRG